MNDNELNKLETYCGIHIHDKDDHHYINVYLVDKALDVIYEWMCEEEESVFDKEFFDKDSIKRMLANSNQCIIQCMSGSKVYLTTVEKLGTKMV
jgi:hypothetical protein